MVNEIGVLDQITGAAFDDAEAESAALNFPCSGVGRRMVPGLGEIICNVDPVMSLSRRKHYRHSYKLNGRVISRDKLAALLK
jgi:hypothetical protein